MGLRNHVLADVLDYVEEWEHQDLHDCLREIMSTWTEEQLRAFARRHGMSVEDGLGA